LGVLLGKGGINGNVRNYYYYLQTNKQTNEWTLIKFNFPFSLWKNNHEK
jgi:hypothetical protein